MVEQTKTVWRSVGADHEAEQAGLKISQIWVAAISVDRRSCRQD
jgi:hypothetical protein